MPFVSKAQRGFMWANHPDIAREFQSATPKGAKLPEHVAKKKKTKQAGTPAVLGQAAAYEPEPLSDPNRKLPPRATSPTSLTDVVGRASKTLSFPKLASLTSAKISHVTTAVVVPVMSRAAEAALFAKTGGLVDEAGMLAPAESILSEGPGSDSGSPEPLADSIKLHPVMRKLSAVLAPALAAMFGKEQTAHVPFAIQGSSLDPNAQSSDQAAQPQTDSLQQQMQAFLPPGAQGGASAAPAAQQAQPGDPSSPAGSAAPGAASATGNPIDQYGPMGGSGMSGLANMSNIPKGASANNLSLADVLSLKKYGFNRTTGAGVGGGLGAISGALAGYGLGHLAEKPSDSLVEPLAIGGGLLGGIFGGAMGRGRQGDVDEAALAPTSFKSMISSVLAGKPSPSSNASSQTEWPKDRSVTIRVGTAHPFHGASNHKAAGVFWKDLPEPQPIRLDSYPNEATDKNDPHESFMPAVRLQEPRFLTQLFSNPKRDYDAAYDAMHSEGDVDGAEDHAVQFGNELTSKHPGRYGALVDPLPLTDKDQTEDWDHVRANRPYQLSPEELELFQRHFSDFLAKHNPPAQPAATKQAYEFGRQLGASKHAEDQTREIGSPEGDLNGPMIRSSAGEGRAAAKLKNPNTTEGEESNSRNVGPADAGEVPPTSEGLAGDYASKQAGSMPQLSPKAAASMSCDERPSYRIADWNKSGPDAWNDSHRMQYFQHRRVDSKMPPPKAASKKAAAGFGDEPIRLTESTPSPDTNYPAYTGPSAQLDLSLVPGMSAGKPSSMAGRMPGGPAAASNPGVGRQAVSPAARPAAASTPGFRSSMTTQRPASMQPQGPVAQPPAASGPGFRSSMSTQRPASMSASQGQPPPTASSATQRPLGSPGLGSGSPAVPQGLLGPAKGSAPFRSSMSPQRPASLGSSVPRSAAPPTGAVQGGMPALGGKLGGGSLGGGGGLGGTKLQTSAPAQSGRFFSK